MSEAIRDMVAILLQTPGWKPDRFGTQKEKTCSRCKRQKPMEKFGVGAALCRQCHTELTQAWREKRKRGELHEL